MSTEILEGLLKQKTLIQREMQIPRISTEIFTQEQIVAIQGLISQAASELYVVHATVGHETIGFEKATGMSGKVSAGKLMAISAVLEILGDGQAAEAVTDLGIEMMSLGFSNYFLMSLKSDTPGFFGHMKNFGSRIVHNLQALEENCQISNGGL